MAEGLVLYVEVMGPRTAGIDGFSEKVANSEGAVTIIDGNHKLCRDRDDCSPVQIRDLTAPDIDGLTMAKLACQSCAALLNFVHQCAFLKTHKNWSGLGRLVESTVRVGTMTYCI